MGEADPNIAPGDRRWNGNVAKRYFHGIWQSTWQLTLIEEARMFKKLCLLTTSLVLVGGTVWAEEPAPYNCDFSPSCEVAPGIYGAMGSPVMSKFKMSIGGYIKLDYANNSNKIGPVLPGAPGGSIAARPATGYQDESILTAKQSRIWFKVAGPTFLGAKTNALVEGDFYGGGAGPSSNEFGNFRMRHAYGSLDWTNTQVLFGQFWDVFGPAAADTIDFRQGGTAGTPNNPRVPQIRLTQKVNFGADNSLKLVLAVQNPVENAGANSSSTLTGTYGSMVNVAGQAIFSSKILGVSPGMMGLGMAPLQLGVFGLDGQSNLQNNGGEKVKSYGYGVYAFVPVLKSSDGKNRAMTLSFEGQVFSGQGLDVLGANQPGLTGAAGTTGRGGFKGNGYYGQLKLYATQDLALTAGHMARLAADADQFGAARYEKKNQESYANLTYDLNAAVRLATEYVHVETRYANAPTAAAGLGAIGLENTFRVAAYYFF